MKIFKKAKEKDLPIGSIYREMANFELEKYRLFNPASIHAGEELQRALFTQANQIAEQIATGMITDAKKLTMDQTFALCVAGGVPYEVVAELNAEKGKDVDPSKIGRLHMRLTRLVGLTIKDRALSITMFDDAAKEPNKENT